MIVPEFKTSDFRGMMFPVHEAHTKHLNPLAAFPELKKYPEFEKLKQRKMFGHIEPMRLFSYMVYVYDRKSPFVIEFDNIMERKKKALLYLGVGGNAKKFNDKVVDIMQCKHDDLNKMIIRFCRMQGSIEYSHLVANTEAYYHIMQEIVKEIRGVDAEDNAKIAKIKTEISIKAKEIVDTIDSLRKSLLSRDRNDKLDRVMWATIEEEIERTIRLSPEQMTYDSDY